MDRGGREREEARIADDNTGSEDAGPVAPEQDADPIFGSLVAGLAAQTMLALGLMAPADSQEVMIDIAQAKQLIDTLMMLREKTKGNLTDTEDGQLTEAISELQRVYVARAQQAQEATLQQAGIDPNSPDLKG